MKENKTEQLDSLVLIPHRILENLVENQEKILQLLENDFRKGETIGDYISEKEAQKMLGKKTTWFWQMRTTGRLKGIKVGSTVFYSRAELLKFFETKNV